MDEQHCLISEEVAAMIAIQYLKAADDHTIGGGTADAFLLQSLHQVSLRIARRCLGEVLLGGYPSNPDLVPFLHGGLQSDI